MTTMQKNGSHQMTAATEERSVTFTPFGSKDSIKLSVAIVKNLICSPTKSGKVCSDAQAMKFIMLCKAKGLNPFENDAYLVGFDSKDGPSFSLITAHQAFLKRAETHPEYDGMESGVIVRDVNGVLVDREGDFFFEDDTLLGGWATVHFKTRKHPKKSRLKLSTFHQGRSRWNIDPAGMIVKCAEADALRGSFPTMLGGLYLDGELAEGSFAGGIIEAKVVSPSKEMSSRILAEPTATAPEDNPADEQWNPPQDEPQTNPDADEPITDPNADAIADDLIGIIEQSKTRHELQSEAGATMKLKRAAIGEALFAKVEAAYQAKYKTLK